MKFIFILLVAVLASTEGAISPQVIPPSSLLNLLLAATTDGTTPSPTATASAHCFDTYLPLLDEVASSFALQYQGCLQIANADANDLMTDAEQMRQQFEQVTAAVCASLQQCSVGSDTLASLHCYEAEGNQKLTDIYGLSVNASHEVNALIDGLQQLKYETAICVNATEERYVHSTAYIYEMLQECLQNSSSAPATPSNTVANVENANMAEAISTTGTTTICSSAAGSGSHTQTSVDGSQSQSQSGGGGCQSQQSAEGGHSQQQTNDNGGQSQSQNTGGGSQSQSQSSGGGDGSQTQSQCSGSDCATDDWKPLSPLFTMPTMAPMATMATMPTMANMPTMAPMATMAPMQPMTTNAGTVQQQQTQCFGSKCDDSKRPTLFPTMATMAPLF